MAHSHCSLLTYSTGHVVSNIPDTRRTNTQSSGSTMTEPMPQPAPEAFGEPSPPAPPEVPDWIADDGLLRDEGVIVGRALSTDPPAPNDGPHHWKLETIRAYYDERRAPLKAQLEAIRQQLARLDRREAELREELARHERALAALAEVEPRLPLTGRNLVLSVMLTVVCALTPLVLAELLPPDRFDHPMAVALALSLFGLFAVFQGRSLLVAADARLSGAPTRPERWKLYALEVLPPLAVALLMAVFVHRPEQGWFATLAIGFAVLLLLLIPGRLLMSLLARTLPELSGWWRMFLHRRRLRRHHHQAAVTRRRELEALAGLRAQIEDETIPQIARKLAFLDARCRRKEALFRSEMELARRRNLLRARHEGNGQMHTVSS